MVYQLHHQVDWPYIQIANLLFITICRRTVTRICKDINNSKLLTQTKKRSLQINRANKLAKINILNTHSIKNRNKLQNISNNQKINLIKNNNFEKVSLIKIQSSKKQNTNINNYHTINNTNININELQKCLEIQASYTNMNTKIFSKNTKNEFQLYFTCKKQYYSFKPTNISNLTIPIFFDREFINWIINNKTINYLQEFENFKNNQLILMNIFKYIKTFNKTDNIIYCIY